MPEPVVKQRHAIDTLRVRGVALNVSGMLIVTSRPNGRYAWDGTFITVDRVPASLRQPSEEPDDLVMKGTSGTFTGSAFVLLSVTVDDDATMSTLNVAGAGELNGLQ
jgi:hypothetical protein